MRPVDYKTEDIIQAGLELQAVGHKVSGFSLRQKVGGGNTKRLQQVWDDYLTSETVRNAEPATEMPGEIAEAVRVIAKALTDQLSKLAIELNDKAVKAAKCRVKEAIISADDQREQAELESPDASQIVDDLKTKIDELKVNAKNLEKKLADAQAVNQAQTMELAELQGRLALTDQAAKMLSKQHAAELERLQIELTEQKHTHQTLFAKNDETHKQTDIICGETAIVAGQLETTKVPIADPMQMRSDPQIRIIDKALYSQKSQVPNPNPDAYNFNPKHGK